VSRIGQEHSWPPPLKEAGFKAARNAGDFNTIFGKRPQRAANGCLMPYVDTGRVSLFFSEARSGGIPVLLLHEWPLW
jgi:hypothetical protein